MIGSDNLNSHIAKGQPATLSASLVPIHSMSLVHNNANYHSRYCVNPRSGYPSLTHLMNEVGVGGKLDAMTDVLCLGMQPDLVALR